MNRRTAETTKLRGLWFASITRSINLVSKKILLDETSEFLCPQCGQTIFDVFAPEIMPCSHLRYAGCSEAPGAPVYIANVLKSLELSNCQEQENLRMVAAALKGHADIFELEDNYGYITLNLVFETEHK